MTKKKVNVNEDELSDILQKGKEYFVFNAIKLDWSASSIDNLIYTEPKLYKTKFEEITIMKDYHGVKTISIIFDKIKLPAFYSWQLRTIQNETIIQYGKWIIADNIQTIKHIIKSWYEEIHLEPIPPYRRIHIYLTKNKNENYLKSIETLKMKPI